MAEIKWVKLCTDMFDNRKIKHLRRLPDGNNIVLIWVMLLTMAGRCNANGMIFLTENIPYTPKMLADELDFEENTVQLALRSLEQLDMIVTDSGFFTIAGWEEHQNIEGMDRIREQNRLRQAKFKAKQKAIEGNVTGNVTVTGSHATEEDKEEDKETDKEERNKERNDCQQIVDLYNSICVSFPSIRSLSETRKKAIRARLKTYTVDDFRNVFKNAEASSFLKGGNDRNWTATFDWLIKDSNMAKVLDGNYVDKAPTAKNTKPVTGKRPSYDLEAFERMILATPAPTAGEDETIRRRAEELQRRLGTNERTG